MSLRRQLLCKQERFVYRNDASDIIERGNVIHVIKNEWIEGFIHLLHRYAMVWNWQNAAVIAANLGRAKIVKEIVEKFGETNALSTFAEACKSGDIKTIKIAISMRGFQTWFVQTGFAYALMNGHLEAMVFLRKAFELRKPHLDNAVEITKGRSCVQGIDTEPKEIPKKARKMMLRWVTTV